MLIEGVGVRFLRLHACPRPGSPYSMGLTVRDQLTKTELATTSAGRIGGQPCANAVVAPDTRVFARDGLRSYRAAIRELQQEGLMHQCCRHRTRPYANNRVESDHRFIKRRLRAMQGPRSAPTARRLIQAIEAAHMIRKGQVLGITRHNLAGQAWVFAALLRVHLLDRSCNTSGKHAERASAGSNACDQGSVFWRDCGVSHRRPGSGAQAKPRTPLSFRSLPVVVLTRAPIERSSSRTE